MEKLTKNLELDYMENFILQNYFETEQICDQLRSLWTAYCLHNNIDVDTAEYDANLQKLYTAMEKSGCEITSVEDLIDAKLDGFFWHNYETFNNFMTYYLV